MENQLDASAKYAATLIEERIKYGTYPVGSWLPLDDDLAAEFAVSLTAVRQAVVVLVEDGLLDMATGHRTSVAKRPLGNKDNTTKLKTIAAIFPHADHPVCHDIIRGIQRTLRLVDSSHRLIVLDTSDGQGKHSPEHEAISLQTVAREGISGAIVWQIGGRTSEPSMACVLSQGIPVVCVDRHPMNVSCDYVGVDNRSGAYQAVEYLIGLGHRRIVHFSHSPDNPESQTTAVVERRLGFEVAVAEHGLDASSKQVYSDYAELVRLIKSGTNDRPTAVFVVNDNCAEQLVRIANGAGVNIPEDISVIGFDGVSGLWDSGAWLTTIKISFHDIGERAAELLLRRIASHKEPPTPHQNLLLPTELLIRSSCKELAHSVAIT